MTEHLMLYELQKMHEALNKTKEEHRLNFRLIKDLTLASLFLIQQIWV